MGPRSQLEIYTASVQRLVNEERSYHKELRSQAEHVKRLEENQADEGDENREYMLNQERRALQETKDVLPTLKQKIDEAVAKLEGLIVEEGHKGAESNVEHITAAKETIANAKTAERHIA